jgi:hypothetical protein
MFGHQGERHCIDSVLAVGPMYMYVYTLSDDINGQCRIHNVHCIGEWVYRRTYDEPTAVSLLRMTSQNTSSVRYVQSANSIVRSGNVWALLLSCHGMWFGRYSPCPEACWCITFRVHPCTTRLVFLTLQCTQVCLAGDWNKKGSNMPRWKKMCKNEMS